MHLQELGLRTRPKRAGFGRDGKAIKIKANHFRVACSLLSAAHYDVTITGMRGRRGDRAAEDEEGEGGGGDGGRPRGRRPDAPTRPLPPEVCRCTPLFPPQSLPHAHVKLSACLDGHHRGRP